MTLPFCIGPSKPFNSLLIQALFFSNHCCSVNYVSHFVLSLVWADGKKYDTSSLSSFLLKKYNIFLLFLRGSLIHHSTRNNCWVCLYSKGCVKADIVSHYTWLSNRYRDRVVCDVFFFFFLFVQGYSERAKENASTEYSGKAVTHPPTVPFLISWRALSS